MEKANEEGKEPRDMKLLRPEGTGSLRETQGKCVWVGNSKQVVGVWEVGQEGQAEPASIAPLGSGPQGPEQGGVDS